MDNRHRATAGAVLEVGVVYNDGPLTDRLVEGPQQSIFSEILLWSNFESDGPAKVGSARVIEEPT
mgnify:CR=1 FL=1